MHERDFPGCPYQAEDGFNDRNRFPKGHLFIGEIENGMRYPLGCYTKAESDERYASKSAEETVTDLQTEYESLSSQVDSMRDEIAEKADVDDIVYVTPQMYGAKADGESDDTLAIQKAITENEGQPIRFPAGTYVISSPVFITKPVSLCGSGVKHTIIKATPVASIDSVFKFVSGSSGSILSGMQINCNNLAECGVLVPQQDNVFINNLMLRDLQVIFATYAYKLNKTFNISIDCCRANSVMNGFVVNDEISDSSAFGGDRLSMRDCAASLSSTSTNGIAFNICKYSLVSMDNCYAGQANIGFYFRNIRGLSLKCGQAEESGNPIVFERESTSTGVVIDSFYSNLTKATATYPDTLIYGGGLRGCINNYINTYQSGASERDYIVQLFAQSRVNVIGETDPQKYVCAFRVARPRDFVFDMYPIAISIDDPPMFAGQTAVVDDETYVGVTSNNQLVWKKNNVEEEVEYTPSTNNVESASGKIIETNKFVIVNLSIVAKRSLSSAYIFISDIPQPIFSKTPLSITDTDGNAVEGLYCYASGSSILLSQSEAGVTYKIYGTYIKSGV